MGELYEKQEDGSLKPIEKPEWLVKEVDLFKWLKCQGLTLDEIRFVLKEMPND